MHRQPSSCSSRSRNRLRWRSGWRTADLPSGLGLHTAADVHHGTAAVQSSRAAVLTAAYRQHSERFVRKPPTPPRLPSTSWINPPEEKEAAAQ